VCQCVCACVLQCGAVCCRVLQCVAVCCSVLQCVAVCCSVMRSRMPGMRTSGIRDQRDDTVCTKELTHDTGSQSIGYIYIYIYIYINTYKSVRP